MRKSKIIAGLKELVFAAVSRCTRFELVATPSRPAAGSEFDVCE